MRRAQDRSAIRGATSIRRTAATSLRAFARVPDDPRRTYHVGLEPPLPGAAQATAVIARAAQGGRCSTARWDASGGGGAPAARRPPAEVIVSSEGLQDAEVAALVARCGVEPLVLTHGIVSRAVDRRDTDRHLRALNRDAAAAPIARRPAILCRGRRHSGSGESGVDPCAAAAAAGRSVCCCPGARCRRGRHGCCARDGSALSRYVYEHVDLVGFARAISGGVAASARRKTGVFEWILPRPAALALGNEGSGLSPALRAEADVPGIPMPGEAESLNVAAAAAVCLFERVRQLTAAEGQVTRRERQNLCVHDG